MPEEVAPLPETASVYASFEKILVVEREYLSDLRQHATERQVDVTELPKLGIEPVTAATVVLVGSAAAVGAVVHLLDQRKGGQVVDLRPDAEKVLYRSPEVLYGLVVVLTSDGKVTITAKEPKGMLNTVVETMASLPADMGRQTVASVTEAVQARLGGNVEVTPSQQDEGGEPTTPES